MISICIPAYNFNVTGLVSELFTQAKLLNVPYEIIIIDDCSHPNFKELNRSVCEKHTYIELPENIGRSKIRNLFLSYAQYNYLLFLDCDSIVASPNFLLNYIKIFEQKPSVICGGRVYDATRPARNRLLRWKYGIYKESQPFTVRNAFPNKSFMTNNFLVDRAVIEKIKFDERLTRYGHEDTLFGYELKKENIAITHIDNPVVNGDLEENAEYLHKTKEGIINLIHMLQFIDYDADLIEDISILKFYNNVKKAELLIKIAFSISKPLIYLLLVRGYVNLYLFDFYKLGIYIENRRRVVN